MGLTRKLTSTMTLGAVDFRSDKERAAAHAKGNKRQAKKQTKLLREQNRLLRQSGSNGSY